MSKAVRRAPKEGYEFSAKSQYREAVWRLLLQTSLRGRSSRVLLLPSTEALEVDVALRYGFKLRHLYAVDSNTAIAATISRKHPGINAFGGSVGEVCERIASDNIMLDAANLDLTGCMSKSLGEELRRVCDSGAFHSRSVVVVTMLRGRESSWYRNIVANAKSVDGIQVKSLAGVRCYVQDGVEVSDADKWRVLWALLYVTKFGSPLVWGAYVSISGQSMIWCAAYHSFAPVPRALVDPMGRPTRTAERWAARLPESNKKDTERASEIAAFKPMWRQR